MDARHLIFAFALSVSLLIHACLGVYMYYFKESLLALPSMDIGLEAKAKKRDSILIRLSKRKPITQTDTSMANSLKSIAVSQSSAAPSLNASNVEKQGILAPVDAQPISNENNKAVLNLREYLRAGAFQNELPESHDVDKWNEILRLSDQIYTSEKEVSIRSNTRRSEKIAPNGVLKVGAQEVIVFEGKCMSSKTMPDGSIWYGLPRPCGFLKSESELMLDKVRRGLKRKAFVRVQSP